MRIYIRLLTAVLLLMGAQTSYCMSYDPEEAIGPEDFKDLRWEDTESCVPRVELDCPQIVSFLRDFIFPIYRNNNGNKDYDRIYLKISDEENGVTKFRLILYLHDKSELKENDFILRNGYNYSAVEIDSIRLIIISKESCPFVKRNRSGEICFKSVNKVYINDACAEWHFELKDGELYQTEFLDWGIKWLRNLKKEQYLLKVRPIVKVFRPNQFSLFREAGISKPRRRPGRVKIYQPDFGPRKR